MADACIAGRPCARRGPHAALSPSFGAPAAPVPWHATQAVSYVDLPAPPAAAVFTGAAGAAVAGAAAGAAAAGAAAGAFGSTFTWATGAMRLATASGDIDGSPVR